MLNSLEVDLTGGWDDGAFMTDFSDVCGGPVCDTSGRQSQQCQSTQDLRRVTGSED